MSSTLSRVNILLNCFGQMSQNDRRNFIEEAQKIHESLEVKEQMVRRLNEFKFLAKEYKDSINALLNNDLAEMIPKHKLVSLFKDLSEANLVTVNEMGHFGICKDDFKMPAPVANNHVAPVVNAVQQLDISHLTSSSSSHQNVAIIQKDICEDKLLIE